MAEKALLRELGSFEQVRRASDERILAVAGVTKRHLAALRKVIRAPVMHDAAAASLSTPASGD